MKSGDAESARRARDGVEDGGIVVINAGSSSIKFALFERSEGERITALARGKIDGVGTEPHVLAVNAAGSRILEHRWAGGAGTRLDELFQFLLEWIGSQPGGQRLMAAGHRVALGGLEHSEPMPADQALIERLQQLVPLAPLHLPRNLEPIEILRKLHPALPQVACFDTAFHRTVPELAQLYALPRELTDAGVRRYGFHGLSYEFIAGALRKVDPAAAAGRVAVAHLGSGASLCAMVGGRSIATTMGFSPLSGIMMGTRPGDVDPGVLLWLVRARGMSAAQVETMLYKDCGLRGVSGISDDMRELLRSVDPRAKEAVELFVYRIVRELGSLASAAAGLDALVFTGGIGENAAPVRAAVCRGIAWLGVALDERANDHGGPKISTDDSRVSVWVLPTDEESMIAGHTAALVAAAR